MNSIVRNLPTAFRAPGAAIALLLLLPLALPVSGQAVPADSVFRDFEPTGDFVLTVDGDDVPNAQIFLSQRAGAYLVMTSKLPEPTLVNLRSRRTETVSVMKLLRRDNGNVDILADANLAPKGEVTIGEGATLTFKVGSQTGVLKPRPELVGSQTGDSIKEYNPEYARKAAIYEPNDQVVGTLKARDDVRMQVFFWTKCTVCSQMVPRVIKVEETLGGQGVDIDYYGLDQPFESHDAARQNDVHQVPTAIVFVGGKEVGRIVGGDLKNPEVALSRILKNNT